MPPVTDLVAVVILLLAAAFSVFIVQDPATWSHRPLPEPASSEVDVLNRLNAAGSDMSTSPTSTFNAVVFGSTGATGRVLTHQLVVNPHTEHVLAITRRHVSDTQEMWGIDKGNTKLRQLVVDYEKELPTPDTVLNGIKYHAAFSALGTTRKAAGGGAAFRRIVYGLAMKGAEWSKKAGIDQLLYVSSKGAKTDSMLLYLQVKGEIERDLRQRRESTLPVVTIAQPGWLQGQRPEYRAFTLMTQSFFRTVYPSILVDVRAIANALIQQATKNLQSPATAAPYTVLSHEQLNQVGVPSDAQSAWEPKPPKR